MIFPTLYKKTSTGALQEWTIYADDGVYYTKFGQTGGTITESEPTICEAKNVFRANATSVAQQAEFEAEALWTKKLKKDYVKTKEEAMAGGKSELVAGGVLPMLAHKFSDHGDKIRYPCFVQPKLDGHRCIFTGGKAWSRTRKMITGVPHIVDALTPPVLSYEVFDGELYNHDYRDKFEKLTHFIRQKIPTEGCDIVQYHIYDMPISDLTFRERYAILEGLFGDAVGDGSLHLVETREAQNEDELMLAFEDFLAQGYEGAIARNADGPYVNKRSYDLQKIKKFDDAEFPCIRVEEGVGKMAGHAIFVCQSSGGGEFKAKMKGSHDDLVKFVSNPGLVVGKMVTVKYQGLTGKNKVPRFPVALRIREEDE